MKQAILPFDKPKLTCAIADICAELGIAPPNQEELPLMFEAINGAGWGWYHREPQTQEQHIEKATFLMDACFLYQIKHLRRFAPEQYATYESDIHRRRAEKYSEIEAMKGNFVIMLDGKRIGSA